MDINKLMSDCVGLFIDSITNSGKQIEIELGDLDENVIVDYHYNAGTPDKNMNGPWENAVEGDKETLEIIGIESKSGYNLTGLLDFVEIDEYVEKKIREHEKNENR